MFRAIRRTPHLFWTTVGVATLGCSDPPTTITPPDDTEPDPVGQWSSAGRMPAALHSFGAAVFDGRLYVTGGDPALNLTARDAYRFDPTTDEWETLNQLPFPVAHHALVVVGDTMYMAGGRRLIGGDQSEAATTLWAYQPDADTWEARADLPEGRYEAASASINGELYLVGGLRSSGVRPTGDSTAIYNPTDNRWRHAPPPIHPRTRAQAVTDQDRLYLVGGNVIAGSFVDVPTVEAFDPAESSWSEVAELPTRRTGTAAVVINERLHVVSGNAVTLSVTPAHEALDLASGTWTTFRPLAEEDARENHRVVVLEGAIHVLGGRVVTTGVFDTIKRFDFP